MVKYDLDDKVVVITGASAGLGEQFAYAFAESGAHVVLGARREDLLKKIAGDVSNKFGIKAISIKTDVAKESDIMVVKVPGSWEIPLVSKRLAEQKKYDAIICLGAVIRGSTPHFEYVSAEVSKGIAAVGLEQSVPITFGVLTTDSLEQAIERAGTKAGNKGFEAAQAAIEMANLMTQLGG